MNHVLSFVLLIFIHIIIVFIYQYSFDEPQLWKDKKYNLSMPTLPFNIKELSSFEICEYLDDAILPTHEYFIKVREIEDIFNKRKDGNVFACWSIFHIFSAVSLGRIIMVSKLPATICLLIAFAIGILCTVIVTKIYKYTPLHISSFQESKEDLQNAFKYYPYRICGISDEDAFNLFVIKSHANYIYSIYKTIVFRNAIARIIAILSFIFYCLFVPYKEL